MDLRMMMNKIKWLYNSFDSLTLSKKMPSRNSTLITLPCFSFLFNTLFSLSCKLRATINQLQFLAVACTVHFTTNSSLYNVHYLLPTADCPHTNAQCKMHNSQCTKQNAWCIMHNAHILMHNAQILMHPQCQML